MAILRGGQAVHHLVERAIPAAGDHQFAAIARRFLGNFRGMARPGCFRQLRLNPVLGKKLPRLVNQAPPRVSAAPRIGVMNQQRVVKSHIHRSDTA